MVAKNRPSIDAADNPSAATAQAIRQPAPRRPTRTSPPTIAGEPRERMIRAAAPSGMMRAALAQSKPPIRAPGTKAGAGETIPRYSSRPREGISKSTANGRYRARVVCQSAARVGGASKPRDRARAQKKRTATGTLNPGHRQQAPSAVTRPIVSRIETRCRGVSPSRVGSVPFADLFILYINSLSIL
jgi:hypothetical protein